MKSQIGSCFMLGFAGPTLPKWLGEFESRFGLGGCILFDYSCTTKTYKNNIESREQLVSLCKSISSLASSPLIFVDQEGGKVRRLKESLGFAHLPSQASFVELDLNKKNEILVQSFREMRDLGIHYDLAPVVDLNLNEKNPNIGAIGRSYSADPTTVESQVAIVNTIAKQTNLGLCLKHFPGLGGAKVDSHLELTDISETISQDEENLFYKIAPTLSGDAILLSHGLVKQWDTKNPVSMSPAAIERIRRKLPNTLLITDDLQMEGLLKHYSIAEASMQGLVAGVDLILIGNNLHGEEKNIFQIAEAIEARAKKDTALANNIEATNKRIAARKRQFC